MKIKTDIRKNTLSTHGHKIIDRRYGLILALAVLESSAGISTEEGTEDERGLGSGQFKRQGLSPDLQAPGLLRSALSSCSFAGELCSPSCSL